MTLVSGVTDTSDTTLDVDFTSTNQDRINVADVPMLSPADLIALPKGQAFCLLQGGQLWKVRYPLPDTSADPAMPAGVRGAGGGRGDAGEIRHRRPVVGGGRPDGGERPWLRPSPAQPRRPIAARSACGSTETPSPCGRGPG